MPVLMEEERSGKPQLSLRRRLMDISKSMFIETCSSFFEHYEIMDLRTSAPMDSRKWHRKNAFRHLRYTDFTYLFVITFLSIHASCDAVIQTTDISRNYTTESTLDVLRDQSLTSPMEINDRSRRCSNITQLSCTSEELEATSVCGSDGRTYSSVCEIKKMVCYGNPVQVIDKNGPCPAKRKCLLERAFQKDVAKRRNQTDIVIPECESDGSYSPVQCHKETGFCWCVTNTGRPIPTTSVQHKRPDCLPQGKVGRRSSRRRLGTRRRGCSTADRSTFSSNLMKIFRNEYEKDSRNRQMVNDQEAAAGVIASRSKQVIDWKFDKLDKNHDGGITPRESLELRQLIRDRVQPKACARRFAKYCDLDGDKRITRSEWSVCLGVDINMSFRLFHSLNTSDEMQRHELQQRQENDQNEEDTSEDEADQTEDAVTSTESPAVGQRSARNKQREERRRVANGDQRPQRPSEQNQHQQTQRRHANVGGLHSGDPLIQASRNMASSAPSSGFSFLSDRTQKVEKDDAEEPSDCKSMRRKAEEDHQRNSASGVYIPKCQAAPDSNGVVGRLFEQVQCHDLVKFCWCVDPETGRPIPGTQKQLEKPDCSELLATSKPGAQSGDAEIKGCTAKKRSDFLRRLHGTLVSSMIASGHPDTEDMSRVERALRWKFDELDKNKNKVLDRKEWKPYRQELKTWKGMKKCGRNFLRSCDANNDRRITLSEWLNCAGNSLRTLSATIPPNNRKGKNPFTNILDPNQ